MNKSELLDTLKNWNLLVEQITSLRETLKELSYRTTPIYENTGGFGGQVNSKVETHFVKKTEIERKLNQTIKTVHICQDAFKYGGLTMIEKETIHCTCDRIESLISVAKKHGTSQAGIYRIRNNALKKMCEYINTYYV